MAILDDVKTALRISHTALDSLLTQQISIAKQEMERNGMDAAVVADTNNLLVTDAIITFCQMRNADTISEMEAYEKSWKYQLDCLRKSTFVPSNPDPEPEPEPEPDPEPSEGGDDDV
jgi:hypothetical protein